MTGLFRFTAAMAVLLAPSFALGNNPGDGSDSIDQPTKILLENYKFPHSEYRRPDVLMGLSLINLKSQQRMAEGKDWEFVRDNLNGFWLNSAGTNDAGSIIKKAKSKRVMFAIGVDNHYPLSFNGSIKRQTGIANKNSLEPIGANVVVDYVPKGQAKYLLSGEMKETRERFRVRGSVEEGTELYIHNFFPNTRHGDWARADPDANLEHTLEHSDGVVYEQNPITLMQGDYYYNRFKNAVIYARKRGKPIIWLAPVGTKLDGWDSRMRAAYARMKEDNILPDTFVPINYSRNGTGMPILPEGKGSVYSNTLTSNARWLLNSIQRDFPGALKNDPVKLSENFPVTMDLSRARTFEFPQRPNVSAALNHSVKIKLKNESKASRVRVYFKTTDEPWFKQKFVNLDLDARSNEFREYTVDVSKHLSWAGTVTHVRLDFMPMHVSEGTVEIKWIKFAR